MNFKKITGFIFCVIILACIMTLTAMADFDLGDWHESEQDAKLNSFVTGTGDFTMDVLAEAEALYLEFANPIDRMGIVFFGGGNEWNWVENSIEVGGTSVTIKLKELAEYDLAIEGDMVKMMMWIDWNQNWEDVGLKKAMLLGEFSGGAASPGEAPPAEAPAGGGAVASGVISGKSLIKAVDFDADKFNESTPQRAADGNWTWYFDSRDSFGNYAHRPEYQANENGPQTEAAEVADYGEIGAICYTHDDEWVQYTVEVKTAGVYDVKVWSSTDAGKGKQINLYAGDKLIGTAETQSKGWGTYNLHDIGTVELAAGTVVLKLEWVQGDVNVAAFEFTPFNASAAPAAGGGEAAEALVAPVIAAARAPKSGDSGIIIFAGIMAVAGVVLFRKKISVK